MDARNLYAQLLGAGLKLSLNADRLRVAPSEALNDEYRAAIRTHRAELMALVVDAAGAPRGCADCRHLLRVGTCYEPVAAGLVDSFGIVWPPDEYGKTCSAFDRKLPRLTA